MGNCITIGVISDTHVPEIARMIPEAVLEEFKKVDMIIHAGDMVDIGVLESLRGACSNIKAVWGNMDPPEIKARLPEKQIFRINNFKIAVIHGNGAPDNMINFLTHIFGAEKPDLIIFGHSHNSLNKKIGKTLFFNPGSPTDKVFARSNSFGIIKISDKITAKIIKL
ncbi:MAG: metallophosphoesterase family protein [Candidatus Omnitrophota bacterium]